MKRTIGLTTGDTEQAVAFAALESVMLVLHGLWDRGMIRPGAVADLVLFDPDALAVTPIRFARDFPAGAARLVFGSEGYDTTIVAGEPLIEHGEPTGALPGVAIRGGAPTAP